MADPVKAEGLVIAYTVGSNIYPLACAKNASMTIQRDMLELAPKTNNTHRQFIPGKRASTITGSGLVKIVGTTQHGIDFFEDLLTTVDTKYTAYLDIIDPQNNYRVYQFQCYVTEVSYDSTVNNFAQYNYSLQVTGGFTELTVVDTYTVAYTCGGWVWWQMVLQLYCQRRASNYTWNCFEWRFSSGSIYNNIKYVRT
jgi:hypothetical protein